MSKTFTVIPYGKRFKTICQVDGVPTVSWVSKNKRSARRKGEEYVYGKRTATRRYTTAHGRRLNEDRSRVPKCAPMISGTGPISKAQFAVLFAGLFGTEHKEQQQ